MMSSDMQSQYVPPSNPFLDFFRGLDDDMIGLIGGLVDGARLQLAQNALTASEQLNLLADLRYEMFDAMQVVADRRSVAAALEGNSRLAEIYRETALTLQRGANQLRDVAMQVRNQELSVLERADLLKRIPGLGILGNLVEYGQIAEAASRGDANAVGQGIYGALGGIAISAGVLAIAGLFSVSSPLILAAIGGASAFGGDRLGKEIWDRYAAQFGNAVLKELGDTTARAEAEGMTLGDIANLIKDLMKQAEGVISPITLDLDGDGIETLSVEQGVRFNHDGNRFVERTGWVGKDDGLLVLDRNGDGSINSGRELFGSETLLANGQRAANGYAALAELDANKDNKITSVDAAWNSLRIWRDLDSNGVSAANELFTLSAAGVTSIRTLYSNSTFVDAQGNAHRQTSTYIRTNGTTGKTADVWFQVDGMDSVALDAPVAVSAEIAALPFLRGSGNVHNLHQSLARDSSGQLLALVREFMAPADRNVDRRALFEQVLFRWTGADQVPAGQTNGGFDLRRLAVLEAFSGQRFVHSGGGVYLGDNASELLEQAYDSLFSRFFDLLERQAPLNIQGSAGDDTITGYAAYGERIESGDGNDNIDGQGGNDLIQTGAGNDQALGGLGDDVLLGALGNDDLNGGAGDDILDGAEGDDQLTGEAGDDLLLGGDGIDTLNGGEGSDRLHGGLGDDQLSGGTGDDVYLVDTGSGHDQIVESSGQDVIRMGIAVSPADLVVERSGYDIVLRNSVTGDTLSISNWYEDQGAQIERIEFADSTVWTGEYIHQLHNQITGTTSDDTLAGGNAAGLGDVLLGLAGKDKLDGRGGDDQIFGGADDDTLTGGTGHDLLAGEEGNDTLHGGLGDDHLIGGIGIDTLNGDDGNDHLLGEAGEDSINGGAGNDHIEGGDAADVITGGIGDDYIDGGDGADLILAEDGQNIVFGRAGSDTLFGGKDSDWFDGGADADVIRTNEGNDLLFGGAGNDVLEGGGGDDKLEGGEGDDILDGDTAGFGLISSLGGVDHIKGGNGNDIASGGGANDLIEGEAGHDVLDGGYGDDLLLGGEGMDTLYGNAGNDELHGGLEGDVLSGGDGIDVLYGELGDDTLSGDGGNDHLMGAEGADRLSGGNDADYLEGGIGNDTLLGDAGNDLLEGGEGNDILDGGAGADTLRGGAGDDILGLAAEVIEQAGAVGDTYDGGMGNDTLRGSVHADTYLFNIGDGQDRIIENGSHQVNDVLRFGQGIASSSIQIVVSGADFVLKRQGSSDQITIHNAVLEERARVERIEFADGTAWDQSKFQQALINSQLQQLTHAISTFNPTGASSPLLSSVLEQPQVTLAASTLNHNVHSL